MRSKLLFYLSILIVLVVVTTPATTQNCYESSIISPSPFMGNNGEIFKLADGSLWEVKYEYEYLYEYYPSVVICPSRGVLIIGEKSLNVESVAAAPSSNKAGSRQAKEWEIFEETNLVGSISGTVQQGQIFKTTSGSIYEVTGLTLQLVLELQPTVTVLRNGDIYKLIVEGFDEPLICKCLNCSTTQNNTTTNKETEIRNYSELVDHLRNSKIIAQDNENTYLGKLSNEFDSESVFNGFGKYGNKFSSSSIWNEFSTFGNEFSSYSPFNEFSSTPPMIIRDGKIIAYLTVNNSINGAVSPKILLVFKEKF